MWHTALDDILINPLIFGLGENIVFTQTHE